MMIHTDEFLETAADKAKLAAQYGAVAFGEAVDRLTPLLDSAAKRVVPVADDAWEAAKQAKRRAAGMAAGTIERIQPTVNSALSRVAPAVDHAHHAIQDDLLPKLVRVLHQAAATPAGQEAREILARLDDRADASMSALKTELVVTRKSSKGKKIATLAVVGAVIGALAVAVRTFLGGREDWAAYEPDEPYVYPDDDYEIDEVIGDTEVTSAPAEAVAEATDKLTGVAESVTDTVETVTESIAEKVSGVFSAVTGTVAAVVDHAKAAVAEAVAPAETAPARAVSEAAKSAGEAAKSATEAVADVAKSTTDTVTQAAKSTTDTVTQAAKSTGDPFSGVARSATEWASDAAASASGTVSEVARSAAERASDAAASASEAVSGVVAEVAATVEAPVEIIPNDSAPYGAGSYVGPIPPDGFTIKGNERSMKYHLPDAAGYARTAADVWFSSEQAAQAAGFVRSQR